MLFRLTYFYIGHCSIVKVKVKVKVKVAHIWAANISQAMAELAEITDSIKQEVLYALWIELFTFDL